MSTSRPIRTLTVLAVADCPNVSLLLDRLRQVLADNPEFEVTSHVVDDQAGAERWGMHGSPTLLVDGVDPFAPAGQQCNVSCRLYRHADGRVEGVPSLAELDAVVRGDDPLTRR